MKAVEEEKINGDRYESYLRMLASLQERAPAWALKPKERKTKRADDTWSMEEWDA